MENLQLVFIPSPAVGHLISAVETAKLLTSRNERLSITILIIKLPDKTYTHSVSSQSNPRLGFVVLPYEDSESSNPISPNTFISSLIDSHKPRVKTIATKIIESDLTRLAGFVLTASMIDVANELGVPSYVYFTSGAAFLGLVLHLQELRDDYNQDITDYKNSDAELIVPSYANPVPTRTPMTPYARC